MRLNAPAPVMDNRRTPLKHGDVDVTVGIICADALILRDPRERVSFEESARRGRVAEMLALAEGPVELSQPDWELIKERLAEKHHAFIVRSVAEAAEAA